MSGTLIVSLDCEGKWGMADDPEIVDDSTLTRDSLRATYGRLLATLDRHQISATFAVVGLFVAGEDVARRHVADSQDDLLRDEWLRFFRMALDRGSTDGWFLEELPEMVRRYGHHELASHGYSHLPFTTRQFTDQHAKEELSLMRDLVQHMGWDVSSMVFPRNGVAYTTILSEYGITRFRNSPERFSYVARTRSLLSELNTRTISEPESMVENRIAGGRFVNWRCGPRRMIPAQVTHTRWQNILEHAGSTGGCAHLWFHPHNLITGHRQWDVVDGILGVAGRLVREERLVSKVFSELGSDS